MAAESILTYKKPGFPKISSSEKSYRTTIEYVGPHATLLSAAPALNTAWGDYVGIVVTNDIEFLPGTTQGLLTVVVEYNYDGSGGGSGSIREITYEVDWVVFQRPMLEHPVFREGGAYALTSYDVSDIESWKNAPPALRAQYQYIDPQDESTVTLQANAQVYAKGWDLGLESYEDYAPVIRKTTTYAGGLPGTSSAGLKDTGPTFNGKPSGYEWRKSADRAIRSAGQTRWDRIEEWMGAKKVLVDKENVYFA